jgi:hypothetical protein
MCWWVSSVPAAACSRELLAAGNAAEHRYNAQTGGTPGIRGPGINGRSCGINANTPARSDHQRADPTSRYTPCLHPRRIGTHAIVVCEGRSHRGSGSKKPHLCLDAMPRKAGELRPTGCHMRQTNASPEDEATAILADTPCWRCQMLAGLGPDPSRV